MKGQASLGLAEGVDDRATGSAAEPDGIIPMGSVTKSWTATGVMQLLEKGKIGSLEVPVPE